MKWTIVVTRVQIVEGVELPTEYEDKALDLSMKKVKSLLADWNTKPAYGIITELWQAFPTPES